VEGHLEIGIGLARGLDDEVRSPVKPRKINAKMRQPVIETDRQQPMCPLPDRIGAQ
jgi:hypothetical protein